MCVLECDCCVSMYGFWWPSMRGGVVVGAQGGGGWVRSIPDIGGVRWSLVEFLTMGEREILVGGCGRSEFSQKSSP